MSVIAPALASARYAASMNKPIDRDAGEPEGDAAPRLRHLRNNIGARLRAVRFHRNLSGVALARAAGISGAMLSKIESAERIPSVPVLAALAAALGVEIGELFGSTAVLSEPVFIPAASSYGARPPENHKHLWIEQLGLVELPEVQVRLLHVRALRGCMPTQPVQFDGFWIDHVLDGEAVVCIGGRDYHLRSGDTLSYRGEVPHYMKAFPAGPAELLVVQGWTHTNAKSRIKLDGALLSAGAR